MVLGPAFYLDSGRVCCGRLLPRGKIFIARIRQNVPSSVRSNIRPDLAIRPGYSGDAAPPELVVLYRHCIYKDAAPPELSPGDQKSAS